MEEEEEEGGDTCQEAHQTGQREHPTLRHPHIKTQHTTNLQSYYVLDFSQSTQWLAPTHKMTSAPFFLPT